MIWKCFDYLSSCDSEQKAVSLYLKPLMEFRRGMSSNRVKLDPSKTELIWFHSGRGPLRCVCDTVLHSNRISPVQIVLYSRVMPDSNLTMSEHVVFVCQNCYSQLRLIHRLGKAVIVESKLLLVHALVHSRLDYCNIVLTLLRVCPCLLCNNYTV